MAKFASMWWGPKLGPLELVCLKSFLYYGHDFTLYVYDKNLEVPKGITVKDANDIVPESYMFSQDWPAMFACYFRLKMLKQEKVTWVDMDVVCLSDDWKETDYMWGKATRMGPNEINNAILRIPSEAPILDFMINYIEEHDKTTFAKTDPGPVLLGDSVVDFGLQEFTREESEFYPIHWAEAFLGVFKNLNAVTQGRINENTRCFHFWGSQVLESAGMNKEEIQEGSFLEWATNKFVLGLESG